MKRLFLLLLLIAVPSSALAEISGRAGVKNFTGGISMTGNRTNGSDQISGVSVNGVINVLAYGAKGDNSTDNSAAFAAALTAVGTSGTLYIPTGTYRWNTASALALGRANCNVTIRGDSTGGTILVPNFSNGDATSFVDGVAEPPQACGGGVRDLWFSPLGLSPMPTNLNLIRVSNMRGIGIRNVTTYGYNGAGDASVYLDPGLGNGSYTEMTRIDNLNSYSTTYMLVLDAKNLSLSLNNTTLTNSHCDIGTGACLYFANFPSKGLALNSNFNFNADVMLAGGSVIRTNTSASYATAGARFDIRAQYTPGSGTGYCFDGPAGGTWSIEGGFIYCAGSFVASNNNDQITYSMVGSTNSSSAADPISVIQNTSGTTLNVTDPGAHGANLVFTNPAGTANNWVINGGYSAGAQGNLAIFDAISGLYPLVIAPGTDVVSMNYGLSSGGPINSSGTVQVTANAPDVAGYSIHDTAASGQTWIWATSATGATQPGGVGGSCIYNNGVAFAQCWDVNGNALIQHFLALGTTTVAALPACVAGLAGRIAEVSDCNTNCGTYRGTTQTGGGTTKILVMCNGSAWEQH